MARNNLEQRVRQLEIEMDNAEDEAEMLKIADTLGQLVHTLQKRRKTRGKHEHTSEIESW